MDLILLFFIRLTLYAFGGFVAYKKRMGWLVAVCVNTSIMAFLFTFYRKDTVFIRALLANLTGLFLVMTALKSMTERPPAPIIKIDTHVANQQVDTQVVDTQTITNKE
ncbi:hypothetical protein H0W80_02815 [Candidatus Saccharibacteria bacterium]|nr:hypothetical protein [Candidatus Saccharibacteria bacterium]